MNYKKTNTRKNIHRESGAALVTVLMISVLLTIACVALLSATGANSRNTTDVLTETKAFYAAESGIQATVNTLRFTTPKINYKTAHNSGNLSAYLNYDYTNPNDANDRRIVIGQTAGGYAANPSAGTAYSIFVADPDNSQSQTTFTTFADFGTNVTNYTTSLTFAGASANKFTRIEWIPNNPNPTTVNFTVDDFVNSALGSFRVTNGTAGGGVVTDIYFRVHYRMVLADNPTISITGKIKASDKTIVLDSAKYKQLGSKVEICTTTACTAVGNPANAVTFPVGAGTSDTIIYAKMDPREPQRLVLKSVGYGPNGARKELEAILRKDPVGGLNSASAVTLLGPAVNPNDPSDRAVFEAGNSAAVTYTGSSASGINVPSFGFVDPTNLINAQTYIANNLTSNNPNAPPQVSPPPALLSYNLPEWQRTPEALDRQIQVYRNSAYGVSRIFANNSSIANPGSATAGGITFCEGNCTVSGSGGGTLVVKGTLTSLGGFDFTGTIIVVGPGGWERAGGGGGQITGNVIIAPYSVSPWAFLPPKYRITGGGASDVIFSAIDDLFLGENSAVTNIIVGVAEK